MSLIEPDDDTVRSMAIGAIFLDFGGKINSIDFHWKDDILVTASDDDSVRLYDIANAKLLKTTYHKKHGTDRICFTHHPSSIICSSKYNLDSTGESLRYLSMYDNRCLRYFKGHKDRIVSLCMSPVNDCFMFGSLNHSVRIWDFHVNACQPIASQFRVTGHYASRVMLTRNNPGILDFSSSDFTPKLWHTSTSSRNIQSSFVTVIGRRWARRKVVGKAELGTIAAVIWWKNNLFGMKSSRKEMERILRYQEMLGFEQVKNDNPHMKGFPWVFIEKRKI
ncbi:hypothetical protein UlMin_027311 [Ulmus minor]